MKARKPGEWPGGDGRYAAVVTGDWRDWRPAIWLTMLGIAAMLLFSPFYLGALFFGAALGAALRIRQRRRRAGPPA